MLLAIDIGNTNTVLGVFREKRLVENWRLFSEHTRTEDEYWITVKLLCDDAGIKTGGLSGVAISSVVPDLTRCFVHMAHKYLKLDPVVVDYKLDLGLELLVREPKQLGADRICNVVAAREFFSSPLIVVDLGTATTFDVLDANGDYIGGAISPGLITASKELVREAAQLHKIDLEPPSRIIGKSTKEHMQSGIFVGHIAMIEGLITRMKNDLKREDVTTVATGGYSEELLKHTSYIQQAHPTLTLEGLRLLYAKNSNHGKQEQ